VCSAIAAGQTLRGLGTCVDIDCIVVGWILWSQDSYYRKLKIKLEWNVIVIKRWIIVYG